MDVKIFADGADVEGILRLAADPLIEGFTTNPTLMRQNGVTDYESFAKEVIAGIEGKPISLEVFADDFDEMERQAVEISSWAENVFVKIPVTNTSGEPSEKLIRRLTEAGVQLNVTALFTEAQVAWVTDALSNGPSSFVSVFAGRVADAGVDPLPIMKSSLELISDQPQIELIWASPREVFNVVQADRIGCHVITVTHDLLKKIPSIGKDLEQFSLETVQMFFDDASHAGYRL